jgi:hypothetical protein
MSVFSQNTTLTINFSGTSLFGQTTKMRRLAADRESSKLTGVGNDSRFGAKLLFRPISGQMEIFHARPTARS